jgi:hypothetical protein
VQYPTNNLNQLREMDSAKCAVHIMISVEEAKAEMKVATDGDLSSRTHLSQPVQNVSSRLALSLLLGISLSASNNIILIQR